MFSANSADWLNSINNPNAFTKQYAGVSNPLGLSNNNAFGRIWPANAPFGNGDVGSSSILDPTGLPLASPNPPFHAPNPSIGGVYVGDVTNRGTVTTQPQQIIPGALSAGAIGTAFLGPPPDTTCRAVFAVVTADGAIVQEHTAKGLDGLAPVGTVQSILGRSWDPPYNNVEPRLGVLMNPYPPFGTVPQLFVSEPFNDTIAVINLVLVVDKNDSAQVVFGLGSVTRISAPELNMPVDLTPVVIDKDDPMWASNTTLDEDSDFYVANQGDNTIVRMRQNGSVVAIWRVTVNEQPLDNVILNGIAASADATGTTPPSTIFATFVDPRSGQGGVLAMPAF